MLRNLNTVKSCAISRNSRAFSKLYKNYVNGQWVQSKGTQMIQIYDPVDSGKVIGQVPQTPKDEFDAIVANAKDTFEEWKRVPIPQRVRFMLKYQELLK